MAHELDCLERNFKVPAWFQSMFFNIKSFRQEPDIMRSDGLICFCGKQGSGKTLSACLYLRNLMRMYPQAICVTNIGLSDVFDSERIRPYTGISDLTSFDNGEYGVIYFLDEIQLEFNSLESKQANMPIFEFVCQQRKARKMVIGTTQVFGRLQKPFREQFKYAVACRHLLGSLFVQDVFTAENVATEDDIKTELVHKGSYVYIASPSDFQLYDTYEMVKRVRGSFNADK